jgi:SAM-dependent methyltransferase
MSASPNPTSKWPKIVPDLTAEQTAINDDFMNRWHEKLPRSYGALDRFNQKFPVKHSRPGFRATLEIGAGLGEHIHYEVLSPEQERHYWALEMRENMAAHIREAYPQVQTLIGDCQQRLDFADGYFDRYLAVHVLEHLPNLPACLSEAWRLLDKERGQLLVVIPCEGGLAYSLARRISAQRFFERTYGVPYEPYISREHLNRPAEILAELAPYFTLEKRGFFPFPFAPFTAPNLVIGLALRPRPSVLGASGSSS